MTNSHHAPDQPLDDGTGRPAAHVPSLRWSRRAILRGAAGGALIAACGCVLGRTTAPVAATGVADSLDAGASATQRADRKWTLRQNGDLIFPMGPTPRCEVLDNYGDPRSSGRRHEGIDILATEGQDVYSVSDGVLIRRADASAALSGNAWGVRATDGTYFYYAHLSAFADGLELGDTVRTGQTIGYVGDTGNPGEGNYHLHFEVHPGGVNTPAVDPLPLIQIPSVCRVY
jgi:murein DD-endopeptidase MepM/ murein hydrolase activator NlpD